MTNRKKLLIIYAGTGKGKTTAALGLALRCAGHGKKVCVCQFIKQTADTGEYKFIDDTCKNVEIHLLGNGFVLDGKNTETHRKSARDGLSVLKQKLLSGKYSLLIADEILDAVELGFIKSSEIIELTDSTTTDILLTGRKIPKDLLDRADTVTEMKEIKHHYQKGIKAIRGIEY